MLTHNVGAGGSGPPINNNFIGLSDILILSRISIFILYRF